MTGTPSTVPDASRRPLRLTHLWLTAQSSILVLISINRLAPITLAPLPPHEFLRFVEANNLTLAFLSLVVSYGLISHLSGGPNGPGPANLGRGLAFLTGAYLLATSYGNHEVTNYLNARFCPARGGGELCEIVRFHDDEFSHLLFFAGFTIVNLCVIAAQVANPVEHPLRRRDRALIGGNALFIAAGIVANLGFEAIGFDLYVVAAVAVTALALAFRHRGQPIVLYYAIAYPAGFLATVLLKVTGN